MTLNDLKISQTARVTSVGGDGALRQHFLDMGLIPGADVVIQKFAPLGDPMQIALHGYVLTLRREDAKEIEVVEAEPQVIPSAVNLKKEHPGFGEEGRYHDPTHENPLPDDTILTFALVGNQNSGKTTLFNQLTGTNQHVGNFPGVTVDRKDGVIKGYPKTRVTDLPGIYSLSPYSKEELVSRQFILESHPHCLINIVDATNFERNLYLTMQLMQLGLPMVLALNMMDELEGNGGTILINQMEEILGIPVVPISALKNQGVAELVRHAVHVAKYQEKPPYRDFCLPTDNNGAVHRSIHSIQHFIEDHAEAAHIPSRFAAVKIVEGDSKIMEMLQLPEGDVHAIEHILEQMEKERGLDRAAAIADMRFSFIRYVASQTVVKMKESKEQKMSLKVDKILTGRYLAAPSFLLILTLIFWLTFDIVGGTLQEWLETGIESVTTAIGEALQAWHVNDVVYSLTIDGICAGVGAVLSFVPVIVMLFLCLSLLEDSGYMARIAFVMDKPMRKIGLSGRSIVPMLMGFGCSVPAVMASRTLPSERDRRLTIMLTPYMSCTAKLPIYVFFTAIFFRETAVLAMISMYVLGIIVAIVMALVVKSTTMRGEAVPFVMELPNYRMPSLKTVTLLAWEKTKDFLTRAFTVIFMASIIIWFLQSFSLHLQLVDDPSQSMLAAIADVVSPIFSPMGFGDWRAVTALVSGLLAKESVVSTLGILYPGGMEGVLTTAAAAAMMVFCLLYTPCMAAVASIKREIGTKYTLLTVFNQCVVAWVVAFIIYNLIVLL